MTHVSYAALCEYDNLEEAWRSLHPSEDSRNAEEMLCRLSNELNWYLYRPLQDPECDDIVCRVIELQCAKHRTHPSEITDRDIQALIRVLFGISIIPFSAAEP